MSESVLDAAAATRSIEAQFPALAPVRATLLGEGYDSRAFDVNDEWVFRFPKRADVARQLAMEQRLLALLEPRSPLPLPAFRFLAEPAPDFPLRFVGYRKLPGVAGNDVEADVLPSFAPALGRFLSWLHAFSVTEAAATGVPCQRSSDVIAEIRVEATADLGLVRTLLPDAPVDAWYRFLADVPDAAVSGERLVHNDLAGEHILVDPDERAITGVIDWSDAAIGDPAVDLAGIFHWGGAALLEAVLAHYSGSIDHGLTTRARWLAACRGVGDIVFAHETNRAEYITAGLRALAFCTDP